MLKLEQKANALSLSLSLLQMCRLNIYKYIENVRFGTLKINLQQDVYINKIHFTIVLYVMALCEWFFRVNLQIAYTCDIPTYFGHRVPVLCAQIAWIQI